MINDFRSTYAFIDYKDYGRLKVWDACWTHGVDKIQDPWIHVFLNFKKVGQWKTKREAREAIEKLIAEAPDSFFEENKDVLLRDLRT
jgi:hypothetical protein